ncbi:PREDICTED: uncharacterized protein LOC109211369 [Nicotiana attenuata]|uniref:uncharacterized protein LOC109211369 n=1 Tax=Nicotiana attenuata TaxID=49451 RepID=UPI000904CED3|nr:PREDICTED: uncharacterized protein LOC109211369 [Nicotiana attenuata]
MSTKANLTEELHGTMTDSKGFSEFTLDPCHPFYVYPSNSPGGQLVTIPFSRTGFVMWRSSMLTSLSAKNKLGLITGRISQPQLDSPYYLFWEHCNNMIKTWISNSLTREIAVNVMCFNTAKKVWKDINDMPYNQRVNFESKRSTSPVTCKYYKKLGHSVDKCYRIHGFPADFKFTKSKRSDACVQVGDSSRTNLIATGTSNNSSDSAYGFSKEQYEHLMTLFQQANFSSGYPQSTSPGENIGFANFAGVQSSLCQFPAVNSAMHSLSAHISTPLSTERSSNLSNFSYFLQGPSLKRSGKAAHGLYFLLPDMVTLSFSSNVSCPTVCNSFRETVIPYFPSSTCNSSGSINKIDLFWHQRSDNAFELGSSSEAISFFADKDVVFYEHIFPYSSTSSSSVFPPSASFEDPSSFHSSTAPSPTPHVAPFAIPRAFSSESHSDSSPSSSHHQEPPAMHVSSSASLTLTGPVPPPNTCLVSTTELQLQEPQYYQHATSHPAWQDAMLKEFQALEANHTWDIVHLPPHKKPIPYKWVYKIKEKSKPSGVGLVAIDLSLGASRQWFSKLSEALCSSGYISSKNDCSLFTKSSGGSLIILAVSVDDILLAGDDIYELHGLKAFLSDTFKIKDLGCVHYSLGLEVIQQPQGLLMCQHKFTSDLLEEFQCDHFTPVSTPLDHSIKLSSDIGEPLSDPSIYRRIVGKLNFLCHTRPDIAYSVQYLSQFQVPHMLAVIHFFRYLVNAPDLGIFLPKSNDLSLLAYSDSDWARLEGLLLGTPSGPK